MIGTQGKRRIFGVVFLICCTGLIIFLTPALGLALDSYEEDDTYAQANVIVLNDESQRHDFHDAGDRDWVKFYGITGEIYEIKVSNAGVFCDAVIELYDTDGTTLLKGPWDWGYEGEDELMDWRSLLDGVYYVMIRHYDSEVFGEGTGYDLDVYRPVDPLTGTIAGIITDSGSGEPIGDAQITTDGNASAISLSVGSYTIVHPAGTCTLTASAMGYESQTYSGVVVSEGETVTQDIEMVPEGGNNNAVVKRSGDDDCFIATAVYGSVMEPHVAVLREFRDVFLLTNRVGKGFVNLYYTWSPPVASYIGEHAGVKSKVRVVLLPFVGMSWIFLKLGPEGIMVFLGLFGFDLIVPGRFHQESS